MNNGYQIAQFNQKLNYYNQKNIKFLPSNDFKLIPFIAFERFGINSSLSGLKYDDASLELK